MSGLFVSHVADRIFNRPLLITQEKFNAIAAGLGIRIGLEDTEGQAIDPRLKARNEPGTSAFPHVALVGVHNTLVHRALGMNALSGLTTYEGIRAQFRAAMNNPEVSTIVLDGYSSGGEVHGVFDTADEIFNARGRGKRIIAIANEVSLSAAYLIMSAADEFYVPRTGAAGSIGVIYQHADLSRADEKLGITYRTFFRGARKNDLNPHEPVTGEAEAVVNAELDRVYGMFVGAVSRYRNLPPEKVRETEAGVFTGEDAVKAGLADGIMSFSELMDGLKKKGARKIMDMAALKHDHPDLYASVVAEGARDAEARMASLKAGFEQEKAALISRSEEAAAQARKEGHEEGAKAGTSEERRRVMEILEADGDPTVTAEAIKEGISAEGAFKKFYLAEREGRKKGLEDLQEKHSQSAGHTARSKGTGGSPDFMAEVEAYATEHRCSRAEAVKAVRRLKPELHAAWLDGQRGE